MSREANATRRVHPCEANASYTVHFQKRPHRRTQRQQEPTTDRVPRVTRLLALAHKIDGMIRAGEIRDWAEAARLLGITRARMTQIANLLLLAPDLQEAILDLPSVLNGQEPITEHELREVVASVHWFDQRIRCGATETLSRPSPAACGSYAVP